MLLTLPLKSQDIVPGYFWKVPYISRSPISVGKSTIIPIKQRQFSMNVRTKNVSYKLSSRWRQNKEQLRKKCTRS